MQSLSENSISSGVHIPDQAHKTQENVATDCEGLQICPPVQERVKCVLKTVKIYV